MVALFTEMEIVGGCGLEVGYGWIKSRVLFGHGRLEMPIRHSWWMMETEVGWGSWIQKSRVQGKSISII